MKRVLLSDSIAPAGEELHLAAVTREARARAGIAAADEMLRILRGERPRNLVNPEVLKKELT